MDLISNRFISSKISSKTYYKFSSQARYLLTSYRTIILIVSLSRELKSMILCESVKQAYKIYDFDMIAYSVSTPPTKGGGVSLSREPKSMILCESLTPLTEEEEFP